MYERRLLRLLLTPSVLSGAVTVGIASVVVAYSGWTYISQNLLFYDALFGAYGFQTFLWQVSNEQMGWRQAFLGSPIAYYLLVAGFALIGGLIVYVALESLRALLGNASILKIGRGRVVSRIGEHKLHELWLRLGLRIVGLVGWTVYIVFFVSTIVGLAITLTETGMAHLETNPGITVAYCASALAALTITLHMHVVFLRLCMLRPRVFGDSAIEEAEAAAGLSGSE